MLGLFIMIVFIFAALFADYIMPYAPNDINRNEALVPPSPAHLLGTDDLGRDVFSRVIYGCRISLRVASVAVLIGLAVGVPLGLFAGYFGFLVDNGIMRVMDVLLAFPDILLALTVISVLGMGIENVTIALGITSVPIFVRLVRGKVLAIRELPYIEAAIATGESQSRIILQEILPNCLTPVIVQATLTAAYTILAEAALSYLGLGTLPPTASWGRMLSEGQPLLLRAPWISIFPGLACMVAVLSINLLADGITSALNPQAGE
jgi:peptide/nickel transport system permease protein